MKRTLFLALLCLSFCQAPAMAESKTMLNSSAYILNHPNLSRKVSLALNDTNIVDALVYLSEKAEINVAVSKAVEGRATLSLNNVSIRDALDIILLSNELAMEKRGEIFYVMPAADYEALHGEKWAEARQIKIFNLRYAKPADVATVLTTMKSGVGSVVVDNDSGTLVAMDTGEKISQMKEAIDSMDHESVTKVFNMQYANAKDVEAALTARLDTKGVGSVKADEKAKEGLRQISSRFEVGAATQLEVLDARVAMTEAQLNSIEALHDYNVALAHLKRATGSDNTYRYQSEE